MYYDMVCYVTDSIKVSFIYCNTLIQFWTITTSKAVVGLNFRVVILKCIMCLQPNVSLVRRLIA